MFEKNCLFVFSDILADNSMMIEAIHDMQQMQENKANQFYKVFVLVPGCCYCLDLDTSRYDICRIESKLQSEQVDKARELVKEYEDMNIL